jgi:hypothetical protein
MWSRSTLTWPKKLRVSCNKIDTDCAMRHASNGVPHFFINTGLKADVTGMSCIKKRLGFSDSKPNPLIDA